MKNVIRSTLIALITSTTLNAVEVNSIYYKNSQKSTVKVNIKLPENWIIKTSQDTSQWGDYLVTREKTVYMSLNLSEWKSTSTQNYADIMKRNGHSESHNDDQTIFYKHITKGGNRILMGRYIAEHDVELHTQLLPYDQGRQMDHELKEAVNILASAQILSLPESTDMADPKIESIKHSLDEQLTKIEKLAVSGAADQFPSICAKTSDAVLKYRYPDAPQELTEYYKNAEAICYGKLHTQALHAKLKKEGKSVCESMEVTLQTNHIKKYTTKTKDDALLNNFIKAYKSICPNNTNIGY